MLGAIVVTLLLANFCVTAGMQINKKYFMANQLPSRIKDAEYNSGELT